MYCQRSRGLGIVRISVSSEKVKAAESCSCIRSYWMYVLYSCCHLLFCSMFVCKVTCDIRKCSAHNGKFLYGIIFKTSQCPLLHGSDLVSFIVKSNIWLEF